MATSINQVAVRDNLAPRREPYWFPLGRGRSVGFRKMSEGTQGAWIGRWRDEEAKKYEYKPLGDLAKTPNKDRHAEAVRKLEPWFAHFEAGGESGDDSVAAVCAAYASAIRRDQERGDAEAREAAAKDAESRFERRVNHDPLGKLPLAKLQHRHVAAWRERLEADGGSKNTINREMTPLRAALNRALEDRKIASAFAWSKALKPLSVDQTEHRRELYLDRAQRRRLIEHASAELRPLVTAWVLLPVRPGEIAACKVQHLDVRNKTLKIPRGKTKTREVPLTEEAFEHFRRCAKSKTPAAWLIAQANGKRWHRNTWGLAMEEAVARAKLPAETVAYSLRHAAITDMVLAGKDIFTVAKISGTSVAQIELHYGKLLADHARKALEVLSLK